MYGFTCIFVYSHHRLAETIKLRKNTWKKLKYLQTQVRYIAQCAYMNRQFVIFALLFLVTVTAEGIKQDCQNTDKFGIV